MSSKHYYSTVCVMAGEHKGVRGRDVLAPWPLPRPLSGMPFCTLGAEKLRTTFPSFLAAPFHTNLASAKQKQRRKDLEHECKHPEVEATCYCCHHVC